jgi:carbonic anhydrase
VIASDPNSSPVNDSYPEIQGILGCADSGVPPELIFDANFGELFIIRVAGNVISPEVMGSIQYAGSHLHTPLFLVLGHERCRTVKAASESKLNGANIIPV